MSISNATAAAASGAAPGGAAVVDLRCEYRTNPLGIDTLRPRLFWRLESDERGQRQMAYRVLVASAADLLAADGGDLWDSGRVESDETIQVEYAGRPLASGQACFWKVRAWDAAGRLLAWSTPAFWTMGLLAPGDWRAQWIGYDAPASAEFLALSPPPPAPQPGAKPGENAPEVYPPPPYLRKAFRIEKPVRRATAYASAFGQYELRINGRRVGDDWFTPGWTDYRKRVYYNTYDVTDLLAAGENAVGAILADGWYAGHLGNFKYRFYGPEPRFLVQMDIEYADGTRDAVATDATWRAAYGPIANTDMFMGETYDARREWPGWDRPGFDAAAWQPPAVGNPQPQALLESYPAVTVRRMEELRAAARTQPVPGRWVYDMGRNMVGWVRLKVRGRPGQRVVLRHAERLRPDGTLYTENLRGARATDTYVLRGGGEETLEPHFTFHGFQYVEITGLDSPPAPEDVAGVVVYSAMPVAGSFACSHPLVNRLFENILWGQKGNHLDIPTDCPQRDERLGWTGDTQFFMRTGAYNMDVSSFFTKWLVTLVQDSQGPDGTFAHVAPDTIGQFGATAWGDAAVICTWHEYRVYGDRRVIERHYPALARFIEHRLGASRDGISSPGGFGDWLDKGGKAPHELLGTAYLAYDLHLMVRMADAIGRTGDARRWREAAEKVRAAFARDFILPDGHIKDSGQTGYALAFGMDLVPPWSRAAVAERFVEDIRLHDWHLTTGFIGTPRLLPALVAAGRTDVAYRLLLQEGYPSWLYQVKLGATTLWERWDGWTPERGFQDPNMNSFNHYAFGSVGEFLYAAVAGIDAETPGYQRLVIRPRPGGGLTWARAAYDSIRGRIVSDWRIEGPTFFLNVTVPANATATVHVPARGAASVTEGGRPATEVPGVTFLGMEDGAAVFRVESGRYAFAAAR